MAKANKAPAPKAAVTVAPVPAPKATAPVAAPVAAPKAAAPAWQGFTHPVTQEQVDLFINTQAGGNEERVGIAALPNLNPGQPAPFLKKQTGSKGRPYIVNCLLWGFVNGHTGPVNVAGVYAHFAKQGEKPQGKLDLLALLNGGFTASSKTWGQPFAQLVVLPAPAQPASK
jgi:hypothetical protein